MADVRVPEVARIHYDDLAGLFRLHISLLLETPAGNFPLETVITAEDLVSLIEQLLSFWPGGGLGPMAPGDRPAWLGDVTALKTWLDTKYPAS